MHRVELKEFKASVNRLVRLFRWPSERNEAKSDTINHAPMISTLIYFLLAHLCASPLADILADTLADILTPMVTCGLSYRFVLR